MSARRILVPAAILIASGCIHDRDKRTTEPVVRPQMPSPVSREKPPAVAIPDPPAVRVLPSGGLTSAPPLLMEPSAPVAVADDDKKPIRERIKERVQERQEKREEKKDKDKPTMPPPVAPKDASKPPVPNAPGSPDAAKWHKLASDKLAAAPDYECRLVRREVVGGKESATEEMVFRFRSQPFSVYMRTTGDAGRGREIVYVAGQNDGKMTVVTGEGDSRLIGAGFKTSLRPDSSMATSKSRHLITDAGFTGPLNKLAKAIDAGQVKSLGPVTRKEYPYPLEGFAITLRPGDDSTLPKGGTLTIHFDSKTDSPGYGLPVVLVTTDASGKEVEYYANDRFKIPAGLTDADFDPSRLGAKK